MDLENQLQEILDYYSRQKDRKDQTVIVEMLRELQEVQGFLPPDLKRRAAEAAGVDASLIQLLIRRYPSLKDAPYIHEIIACTGERCGNKNGLAVLEAVRKELHIQKDGLSADEKTLLKTRCCLKKCRSAANLYLDGRLYSAVTPERVPEILQKAFQNEA